MTAETETLTLCRDLKAAIDAKMLGKSVTSAGRSGRSVSYSETSLDNLIAYYRQNRAALTPDEQALVPDIQPLKAGSGERRPPARYMTRPGV